MSAKPIKTKVTTEQLWREYESGMSTVQLGIRYGCTAWNIVQRLHIAGHELRPRKKRSPTPKLNRKMTLLRQLDDTLGMHEYTTKDTVQDLEQALAWALEDVRRAIGG